MHRAPSALVQNIAVRFDSKERWKWKMVQQQFWRQSIAEDEEVAFEECREGSPLGADDKAGTKKTKVGSYCFCSMNQEITIKDGGSTSTAAAADIKVNCTDRTDSKGWLAIATLKTSSKPSKMRYQA